MKIIKQSKVKKAGGGGGVVVADKLFTAVILLPEEIERLIYSYLPTPERWGKEMILNRYNIPTIAHLMLRVSIEFIDFKTIIEPIAVEYRKITKGLKWMKRSRSTHGDYLIPPKQRNSNPFLNDDLELYISMPLMFGLEDDNADYNILRDTVLICKYYLECKKRNDALKRKYRAEYNKMRCEGLLTAVLK
jgi:hypothetical protein